MICAQSSKHNREWPREREFQILRKINVAQRSRSTKAAGKKREKIQKYQHTVLLSNGSQVTRVSQHPASTFVAPEFETLLLSAGR
jgi:hypothetical protein